MKKFIVLSILFLTASTFVVNAQTKKTEEVTFVVSMNCHNCQSKIEKNISWEKGVKDLKVDLEKKTVTVTYDPKRTNEETLKKAIEKLDFKCGKP